MNVLARYLFAVLVATVFFTGCVQPPRTAQATAPEAKAGGARLSAADAIRIAKQEAEHQGVDLGRYKEPEAHYEFTRKDRSWFVFFDGRVPMPGNHFSVYVDDRTGAAQFHGGR